MTVPKLRFKEFNGDWSSNKLKQLTDVLRCGVASTPTYVEEGGYPFLSAQNVSRDGLMDYSKVNNISAEFYKKISKTKLLKGDILYSRVGASYGVASIFDKDEEYGVYVSLTHIRANKDLDNVFLKLFLNSPKARVQAERGVFQGGGVQNLNVGVVEEFELSIPSKPEQTKIATFLSAVDEKINQLSQKLQLLGQYKQGMMHKLFSQQIRFKADDGSEFEEWEERKLSEISQKAMYGMNAAATEYDGINKYLRITDICEFSNSFKMDNLTSPNAELDDKYKLQLGDLLFARTGASVGKSYLYKENDGITYFAGFLIKFSLNTNLVIPYFIFLQTLTKGFSQWVVTNSMRSGQPGINAEEYSSYIFKVPCLAEQTKIANFLSSIDQKIDVVSKQLEQAKLWKKGLLQQMFV